jgi:hypothetical protein
MINLAGKRNCDETILEELYLANIPAIRCEESTGEVPYSYEGKIGNWTFRRRWYYWSVSVGDKEVGLPLKDALQLHNKKHPFNDSILGNIIRSGGHAGAPSPDEYGAQPIYNEALNDALVALGYEKKFYEHINQWHVPISVGEVSSLCNSGKLTVERYVDNYHIDEQIGLIEFAKVAFKQYQDWINE